MSSILLQFLVGLLILPLAVLFGVILVLLYTFYSTNLIDVFIKLGVFIALPGSHIKSLMIDGMNISYMDRSGKDDNQPTLVFIHGITGQKLAWIPLLRQLPSSWRIIAFDLPGHGESDFSEDLTYHHYTFAAIMHKLFVALDLKNVHIIGESIGSIIAFHYAFAHPERVASRIVLCPLALYRMGGNSTPTIDYLYGERQGKNPLLPTSTNEFQKMLDLVVYQPKRLFIPKFLVKIILKIQMKYYPKFEKVMDDMISVSKGDITERYTTMVTSNHTPILSLFGQYDQICDISCADIMKKIAPWTKVVIINDCGHALSVDKPGKCAHLIEEFIEKESSCTSD